MFTKHIAAGLLATTMLAAPAFAQTNPSTTAPAAPAAPATTAPMNAAPATAPGPNGMQFYTQSSGQDWRASKFMGVDIYGADNAKIGDVNDLILDHQGNIQAVVIGVGGFLGMGEKDVAVSFKTVEWMTQPVRSAATANNNAANNATVATGSGTSAGTAANSTMAGNTNRPAGSTDVTGTTVASGALGYPDHGVLRMTKDQLQSAPTYRYPDDTRATAQ